MWGKRLILSGCVLVICLRMFAPGALFGQSASTGLVTGVVSDPSGDVIAGATVTLQQRGTSATRNAHSDSEGRYVFPAVNPADYTLTIAAQGFATTVINELKVEVQKSSTVNMTLKIGEAAQTINVSEA